MEKMKARVLTAVGNLELKQVDIPQIKSGEVLLRVRACGICGSDIPRIFTTGTYHFPTIPGHEFAGEVVAAFDDENKPLVLTYEQCQEECEAFEKFIFNRRKLLYEFSEYNKECRKLDIKAQS